MDTHLGKIAKATFGLCGYQGAQIGLMVDIQGKSSCVTDTKCAWDSTLVQHTANSKWTEEERGNQYADIVRFVSKLLSQAKVDSVDQLVGKPVEFKTDGMMLKEWRILTEVL